MRKQADSSSVLKYDESILQSGYSRWLHSLSYSDRPDFEFPFLYLVGTIMFSRGWNSILLKSLCLFLPILLFV